MDAVVFSPHSVIHSFSFFAFKKQQLKLNLYSKEIADVPSVFRLRKDLSQITFSSIGSDGSSRGQAPRRSSASKRTSKGSNRRTPQQSDGDNTSSSSQKEIMALFRRIQTAISKGDSANAKKNYSNTSEKKTSVEPVLEIIRRSSGQGKDATVDKGEDMELSRRRDLPTEQVSQEKTSRMKFKLPQSISKEQELKEYPAVAQYKPSRPRSNFVKKSPIPSTLASKQNVLMPSSEVSVPGSEARPDAPSSEIPANASKKESSESLNLEKLKLPELKALAKSRGIRGYSKMRKSELVELLES